MKVCYRCQCELPLSEFYRCPRRADGLLGKCKECTKKDERSWRKARDLDRLLKDRERDRLKSQKTRNEGKAARARPESWKKWQTLNPLKKKAHSIVKRALKAKRLEREPCKICGSELSEAHHEDYSKPLDVTWFCHKHHAERHVAIREQSLRESFAS
jgi:hypothetical protein